MSAWFQKKSRPPSGREGHKKKVQEPNDGSNSPRAFMLRSDYHSTRNPLDWSAMPTSLQITFPHWKDTSVPSPVMPMRKEKDMEIIFKKPIVNGTPDNAIPYIVMDCDTLISIALKFDTTPAEITRINKKPFIGNASLFSGELLYIPDSSCVKCPPPPAKVNCVDKEEVLEPNERQDSVEEAWPKKDDRVDDSNHRKSEDFGRGRSSSLVEMEEEVTDTHVYVSSKFMSNQLCVHGFLVINAQSVMFQPNTEDPLVEDNGRDPYEVLLPLKEIVHSYITRDYSPPCSYDSSLQSPSYIISPKHASSLSSPDHSPNIPGNASDPEVNASHEHDPANSTDIDSTVRNGPEAMNENETFNNELEVGIGNETLKNASEVDANETLKNGAEAEIGNETLKNRAEAEIGNESSNFESTVNDLTESISESARKLDDTETRTPGSETGANIHSEIDSSTDLKFDSICGVVVEHEGKLQDISRYVQEAVSAPGSGKSEDCPQYDYSLTQQDLEPVQTRHQSTERSEQSEQCPVQNGSQYPDQSVDSTGRNGNQSSNGSETTQPHECLNRQLSRRDTLNSLFQESLEKSTSSSASESGEEPAPSPWYFLYCRLSQISQQRSSFPLVGVEIPVREHKMSRPPAVQAVRTWFIFAIPKKSVEHIYKFLCDKHPALDPSQSRVTEPRLVGTRLEIINIKGNFSDDSLLISESHFLEPASSWEIFSVRDIQPPLIESMNVEHSLPLPNLAEPSDLLQNTHIRKLMPNLVSGAVSHDWYPVYSTFKHGFSLHTLYRNMVDFKESPVLLVVQDSFGKLFGAMVSCPLRISERFYGTGESFLFTFEQEEIIVFPWIGENDYVVKGSTDSIAFGSGDGIFGLWLDEGLYHGSSSTCGTFHNCPLASKQDFIIHGVEAWGFV